MAHRSVHVADVLGAATALLRRTSAAPGLVAWLVANLLAERERWLLWLPVGLGAWADANVRHPGVRRALLLMAAVIFHPRPAEASAGRFMLFFQYPKGLPHIADDGEAGGMQGLMEPWARAIRARGGEIALGWKPVEIVGVSPAQVRLLRGGTPTHCVNSRKRDTALIELSAQGRRRTPPAFGEFLVELARSSRARTEAA